MRGLVGREKIYGWKGWWCKQFGALCRPTRVVYAGETKRGLGQKSYEQVLFVLVPCGWDGEFALEEMTTKERHIPSSLLTFFPLSLTWNSPACTRRLAPQVCGWVEGRTNAHNRHHNSATNHFPTLLFPDFMPSRTSAYHLTITSSVPFYLSSASSLNKLAGDK
jgi:hypothetical protein